MAYTQKTWEKNDLIEASDLNNMEQGIKDNDSAISTLEDRTTANESSISNLNTEVEDRVPKCSTASNGYTSTVYTAGYLTNSNTHVYFMIPITDRDRTIKSLTVNSLQIRQNWSGNSGNGYLVGTSSSSASFEGVASISQGPFGTRVRFSYSTDDGGPGSIGGLNNSPVGVTANMTIVFE